VKKWAPQICWSSHSKKQELELAIENWRLKNKLKEEVKDSQAPDWSSYVESATLSRRTKLLKIQEIEKAGRRY